MKCPHCLDSFHEDFNEIELSNERPDEVLFTWSSHTTICPECNQITIFLRKSWNFDHYQRKQEYLVYPKGISRAPLPKEVPGKYSEDYKEACLVLADSAKASAALSRRCLQNILRDELKVKKADLSAEIQEVLDRNNMPSHITDGLDAVRNIGNFAAHPIKSTNTREIVDVELGEAEWNLEVVEALFDYCFVAPAKMAERRKKLNEKLKEAGKPLLK